MVVHERSFLVGMQVLQDALVALLEGLVVVVLDHVVELARVQEGGRVEVLRDVLSEYHVWVRVFIETFLRLLERRAFLITVN